MPHAAPPMDDTPHTWVGAATVMLTSQEARTATVRNAVRLAALTRVVVLETYCSGCRRPYDDVVDEPCSAAPGRNDHLRGGPIGERRKRLHANHDCTAVGCVDPDTGKPMTPAQPYIDRALRMAAAAR